MEVFIQFILENIWLVVMVGIALLGIIVLGALLIINTIKSRNAKAPRMIAADDKEVGKAE